MLPSSQSDTAPRATCVCRPPCICIGAVLTARCAAPQGVHPSSGIIAGQQAVRVGVQVTKEEAEQCMAHEPYKLELVRDILARDPGATITLYHIGKRHPCKAVGPWDCVAVEACTPWDRHIHADWLVQIANYRNMPDIGS